MPTKPKRPCVICGRLSINGRCELHPKAPFRKEGNQRYDDHRPSPAERGYDARWRAYRQQYIKDNPHCRICGQPATDVDHIIPVHGPDDPLFWEASNHQPLCHTCHSRKGHHDGSRQG